MEKLPARGEIDDKYKWKLEAMYQDNSFWEKDYESVSASLKKIGAFQGHLGESGQNIVDCYRLVDELSQTAEKVYVYARMRLDEDNGISLYQDMSARAEGLMTEFGAAVSFVEPEVVSIGWPRLEQFIRETEGLALYRFALEQLYRLQDHVLSQKEERILAMCGDLAQTGKDAFTMFNNADLVFPAIKGEDGRKVELTKGRYGTFLESKDRKVRKRAFKELYRAYGAYRNTVAACLAGSVKKDKFYASVRKYDSCLAAALAEDNVPTAVYDNLIETIHDHLDLLGRYLELRKKVLDVGRLHMYDLYTPLISVPDKKYSYEEALELVLEALRPLGEEYCAVLREGCASGWVDVCENQGKTTGAYSWGCYLSHPYVLLNWQGTINDVFTLAHELGHAMHSYYSHKTQPYVYSDYTIFVAEVASTVNENLLMSSLLRNTRKKTEKAYLINHYLEDFRATVFRQVMFAEFEKQIHQLAEDGGSLTAETLSSLYRELNRKYFGKHVVIDPEIALEWARIPHFYTSFYVYKYATGFSSAVALASAISNQEDGAAERYLAFLQSGGKAYPLELLREAGVDLTTSAPIREALAVFRRNLDEFAALL